MTEYSFKSYNRKKQFARVKLGVQCFVLYPILNLLWFLPFASFLLLNQLKSFFLEVFSVAEIMRPIFKFSLIVATIIIPIALIFSILLTVAEFTARKYESKVAMCFDKKQLENGTPILLSKKHGRNNNITIIKFFSYIPRHIWEERQMFFEDILNVRIVSIDYGEKPNTLTVTTAKGRVSKIEDKIYDETI